MDSILSSIWINNWSLGGAILLVSLFIIVSYPEVGMTLLSTLSYVLNEIHFPRSSLLIFVAAFTLGSLALYIYDHRGVRDPLRTVFREPLFWLVLSYMGLMVFSYLVFSRFDELSLGARIIRFSFAINIIPFIGIMIIARDRYRLQRFINLMCLGIGVALILFSISFLDVVLLAKYSAAQWRTFVNVFGLSALSFGGYAFVGMLLGIVWIGGYPAKTIARKAAFPFAAACFFFLVLTGSRGIAASFVIGFGYFLWKVRRVGRSILKFSFFITLIVIAAFFIIPGGTDIWTVLISRLESTMGEPVGMIPRMVTYKYAIEQFLEAPLFGVGVGMGGPVTLGMPVWLEYGTEPGIFFRTSVHSFYLTALVEQGVVGAAVVVLIIVRTIRLIKNGKNAPSSHRMDDLRLIAVTSLVFSLLSGILGSATFFYWSVALIWATGYEGIPKREHMPMQVETGSFNPSGNSPPVRVGMRAISNLAFASVKDRLDK
ncbi:MAG: O-antigen ligase family protein [Deltaproteobacteria bacterium]|nr:O-antigen ligase family protein [Deltaproteobacteria bacterium]